MPTKKIAQRKKTCTKDTCDSTHNFFHKLFCKHIHRIHKNGHRLIKHLHNAHHHLGHTGELTIIAGIFACNLFGSGFAANTGNVMLTDHTIVASNFIAAEKKGAPSGNDSKIISMRQMDGSVNNTFTPGYCTYGAARISPEFFPYTDTLIQQRTWGGNAKDRCENAQATGYQIGSTPSEGALVVYDSTTFGHVGKVMYHNASKGTLIVRDMNRAGKFVMTDRRESSANTSIKCYIYAKKTVLVINDDPPEIVTPPTTPVVTTGTIITPTVIITPPQIPTTPVTPTTPTTPQIPTTPIIVPPAIITPEIPIATNTMQTIELNFDNVSDLAQHFITQRNIEAKLAAKTLKVGEKTTLTITIKDINTQAGFEGLLKPPFELITSNNNIETNYSLIQLMKDGRIDIAITAKNVGETTLLVNFDGTKISKINFSVY